MCIFVLFLFFMVYNITSIFLEQVKFWFNIVVIVALSHFGPLIDWSLIIMGSYFFGETERFT